MSTSSPPGLCTTCIHSRTIQNDRGSVFWLCEASKFNPKLSKYPRLPVLKCEEYRNRDVAPHSQSGVQPDEEQEIEK